MVIGLKRADDWRHRNFSLQRFEDGRKSIADDSRSGRPLTSTTDRNIGQVCDLIVADIKNTIDNLSEILGISY
ncbi:hypothetical protein LAZ67_16001517, partial [Cordylochernes scorpioides]